MQGQGFQRVQVWKGEPDVFTMNRIVGSVALSCIPYCGWALALAFNAACIVYEMAEGTINIQQGGLQVGIAIVGAVANAYTAGVGGTALNTAVQAGMGAATTVAASGVNYQADGWINYDFSKVGRSLKGELFKTMVSFLANRYVGAVGGSMITQTLMSSFNTRGNFWEIGFDTNNMAQHVATGLAAGATTSMNQTGIVNNPYAIKAVSGGISSAIMMGMYNITGGAGFSSDQSMFNWNSMYMNTEDVGKELGESIGRSRNDANSDDTEKNKVKSKKEKDGNDEETQNQNTVNVTNAKNTVQPTAETSLLGSLWNGILRWTPSSIQFFFRNKIDAHAA